MSMFISIREDSRYWWMARRRLWEAALRVYVYSPFVRIRVIRGWRVGGYGKPPYVPMFILHSCGFASFVDGASAAMGSRPTCLCLSPFVWIRVIRGWRYLAHPAQEFGEARRPLGGFGACEFARAGALWYNERAR